MPTVKETLVLAKAFGLGPFRPKVSARSSQPEVFCEPAYSAAPKEVANPKERQIIVQFSLTHAFLTGSLIGEVTDPKGSTREIEFTCQGTDDANMVYLWEDTLLRDRYNFAC